MRGIFTTLLTITISLSISSQTIWSVQDGNWNDQTTWNLDRIPNTDDFVKVSHVVSLNVEDQVIEELEISNYANSTAGLSITLEGAFHVNSVINIFSGNHNNDVALILNSNSQIFTDTLFVQREISNETKNTAGIYINDNSLLTVNEIFTYEYDGPTDNSEDEKEIVIRGNGRVSVGSDVNININSGSAFSFELQNRASFDCGRNFNYHFNQADSTAFFLSEQSSLVVHGEANFTNNSLTSKQLNLNFNGFVDAKKELNITTNEASAVTNLNMNSDSSEVWVGEKLGLYSFYDQSVFIKMTHKSHFYVKNLVDRPNGFGNLTMGAHAIWEYAGNGVQPIALSTGSGADKFQFSNIVFAPSETGVMKLQGDLTITKSLDLSRGIIETNDNAMLIIEDGAQIIGASEKSYVQGPMKKINLNGTDPFVFPLGHNGKYAPMAIQDASGRGAGGEYTAKYLNCPPPWGGELAVNLTQISDEDHWVLERTPGKDVNVILHWSDAEAQGIQDLSTLAVAMYNPDAIQYPGFPAGWTSIGNGGTTGGVGNGVSGSIMNIGTCPPPWGIEHFSIGSTSNSNALPVEMESFSAKLVGETVDVKWRTINEANADYFIVEKSYDGASFFEIDRVGDQDQTSTFGTYGVTDIKPQFGSNYYRIVQVDFDGMSAFTDVKIVDYTPVSDIISFPNPTNEYVTITGNIASKAEFIDVMNSNGSVLFTKEIQSKDQLIEMSLSELNIKISGIYFIKISSGGRAETVRIVKN